jgi:hypothetical protein
VTVLSGQKDPNDIADYALSWATQLGTDTITGSSWIVPTGITADDDSSTDTTATVRLSGGTAGEEYEITNRVVTAGGQQFDCSLRIYVRER